MKRFLGMRFLPLCPDGGLLLLRVWVGALLFVKHGWEKPTTFGTMLQHFPNPIGIGSGPSLVIALLADFVCAALVVIGLATRWAALFVFCNIAVAWSLVHHFELLGKQADHGEVCVLYMGAFLTLALTGAGRHSVDARLGL